VSAQSVPATGSIARHEVELVNVVVSHGAMSVALHTTASEASMGVASTAASPDGLAVSSPPHPVTTRHTSTQMDVALMKALRTAESAA
jgi:hypothetical protein